MHESVCNLPFILQFLNLVVCLSTIVKGNDSCQKVTLLRKKAKHTFFQLHDSNL